MRTTLLWIAAMLCLWAPFMLLTGGIEAAQRRYVLWKGAPAVGVVTGVSAARSGLRVDFSYRTADGRQNDGFSLAGGNSFGAAFKGRPVLIHFLSAPDPRLASSAALDDDLGFERSLLIQAGCLIAATLLLRLMRRA